MKWYRKVGAMGWGWEWGVSVQNWEGEKFWRWMVAMVAQQLYVYFIAIKNGNGSKRCWFFKKVLTWQSKLSTLCQFQNIGGTFDWLMKSKTLGPLVCFTDLQNGKDLEGPLMYHTPILLSLFHIHHGNWAFRTLCFKKLKEHGLRIFLPDGMALW